MYDTRTAYVFNHKAENPDMYGPCPDCGDEDCYDWACNGEADEYEHELDHEQNVSDDEVPMFSVVGRIFYDKGADKFGYFDPETGRTIKLKW